MIRYPCVDCGEVVARKFKAPERSPIRCEDCKVKWKNHRSAVWEANNPETRKKVVADFYGRNGGSSYIYQQKLGVKSVSPEKKREYGIKSRYGITLEEYADLLSSQGGGCAICGKRPKSRNLPIDHCHFSGRVRGILCDKCNVTLGFMGDSKEEIYKNAEKLIAYLARSENENTNPIQRTPGYDPTFQIVD